MQKYVKQPKMAPDPDYEISPEYFVNMGPSEREPLERVIAAYGCQGRTVYWHQYPNRPHYGGSFIRVNLIILDQLLEYHA